ncbi:site-specific integrase [Pelagibius sp. CAU 1746]|uniref:site-specific integrase n=1 Tax=Pelagibius sp. CAU 1746 TaxID=3140370 RepID=UPI00325A63A3
MPKLRLRHPNIPPTLSGWLLVDERQLPRFWATVWADVLLAGVEDGTRAGHLGAVEALYQAVAEQAGSDQLDAMISALEFDSLEAALGGFLAKLRNQSAVQGVDRDATWKSALRFVDDVVAHLGQASSDRMAEISANLLRLERLYGQIAPTPPRPPAPIRALPAMVVEELYELFNPKSARNPFRTDALRYRNYLIFLMLLHLGLRRGEVLILPADAVKDDYDPATGATRYWINIDETPYEDEDPRHSAPGLKTASSRRQLPLSREIVNLVDIYVRNYRRNPYHSFLLNSQKRKPLAPQSLAKVFSVITANLSERALKVLSDRGKSSVSPHDLRHTAAVVRLAKYVSGGVDLDTAIEKLRVFFGWSPTSQMPRHYARAYFETSLADVWNESFDSYVDALRGLTGEKG